LNYLLYLKDNIHCCLGSPQTRNNLSKKAHTGRNIWRYHRIHCIYRIHRRVGGVGGRSRSVGSATHS
jgi:hypothetical protein